MEKSKINFLPHDIDLMLAEHPPVNISEAKNANPEAYSTVICFDKLRNQLYETLCGDERNRRDQRRHHHHFPISTAPNQDYPNSGLKIMVQVYKR